MVGLRRFTGGVGADGAGSVTAGVATTAGSDAPAAGSSAFAFRFIARRRLFFFPFLAIVFSRDETPREVWTPASRKDLLTDDNVGGRRHDLLGFHRIV